MGDVTNLSPNPQRQVGVLRVDYDKNCDRFRVLPSCYPRSHYSVRMVRVTLLKAAAVGLRLLRGQRQSSTPVQQAWLKLGSAPRVTGRRWQGANFRQTLFRGFSQQTNQDETWREEPHQTCVARYLLKLGRGLWLRAVQRPGIFGNWAQLLKGWSSSVVRELLSVTASTQYFCETRCIKEGIDYRNPEGPLLCLPLQALAILHHL